MSDELDAVVIPEVEPGVYRHYRGNTYEVLGAALHSETLKPLVVYRPLYETKVPFWVRPYEMFFEVVEVDGQAIPRFQKISDT